MGSYALALRTFPLRPICHILSCVLLAFLPLACPPPHPPGGEGEDLIAPEVLTGIINARNVDIPLGTETMVAGDVEIIATGDVTIGGILTTELSDGDGYNITVRAGGDIVIDGIIEAGISTKAFGGKQASDENGMAGGGVFFHTEGDIVIGRNSFITTGSGTNGAAGEFGGSGGKGGDLYYEAEGAVSIYGTLLIGSGGQGGDADGFLANARAEYNNRGGDSGFFYLFASEVDCPGYDSEYHTIDPAVYNNRAQQSRGLLLPASGGNAGMVTLTSGPGDCNSVVGPASNLIGPTSIRAADGGRGWTLGGIGGSVLISAQCYWRGLDGVDLEGVAGSGGGLGPVTDFGSFDGYVYVLQATAGVGGQAEVQTSNGRLSGSRVLAGGRGGHATARGGTGGEGGRPGQQTGGRGGDARAYGGGGGGGWPLECDDPIEAGGDGGAGGNSEAIAGNGGDGFTPGLGGTASVFEFPPFSSGADGGRGMPGGAGGAAGSWRITDGAPGRRDTSETQVTITTSGAGIAGIGGETWNPSTECGN